MSVLQEAITMLNIYVTNNRASKYLKQNWLIELQREIDKSMIILKDFNTPLSITCKTSRQKIGKDIGVLHNIIRQLDLIDIYRTHHPTTAEYAFFSGAYGNFTKIGYILDHKTRLNKFQRSKVKQSKFSHYNGIKLEINNRKISGKYPNIWKLNNTLLYKLCFKEKNQKGKFKGKLENI